MDYEKMNYFYKLLQISNFKVIYLKNMYLLLI